MSSLRRRLRPLGRFLRQVYSRRRNFLFDFDLAAPIPEIPASCPLLFRAATREEVVALLADPQQEVRSSDARRHLALFDAGEPFFLGLEAGRIVYRAWAVRRSWRIAGPHHLAPGRGKATILGCFTVADRRGRGIYPLALAAHLRLLKDAGVSRVFINVEEANAASRRGIEKAGFRLLGAYAIVRRAGRVTLLMDPALRRAVEEDHPG